MTQARADAVAFSEPSNLTYGTGRHCADPVAQSQFPAAVVSGPGAADAESSSLASL